MMAGSVSSTNIARLPDEVGPLVEINRRYSHNSALTKEESEDLPGLPVRAYPKEKQNEIGKVRYGAGLTINLGNFESCRLDVALEFPCIVEEAEEAFATVKAFVDSKLEAERDAINDYKRSVK